MRVQTKLGWTQNSWNDSFQDGSVFLFLLKAQSVSRARAPLLPIAILLVTSFSDCMNLHPNFSHFTLARSGLNAEVFWYSYGDQNMMHRVGF